MYHTTKEPEWVANGLLLVIVGFLLTLVGYSLFWADFGSSPVLVPNIGTIIPIFVMIVIVSLLIGFVGYYGSTRSAQVGGTVFLLLFVMAYLDVFFNFPFGITQEEFLTHGLPLLGLLVLGIAYYEHRADHMYL